MKTLFILIIYFSILSFTYTNNTPHVYEDAYIKCAYETYNGMLNGNYVSYYKNGQKKSEGTFENNYRKGTWTVWDSTGRLRMQRVYSDPFTFKQIIPKVSTDAPIKLLNVSPYQIKYNKDNYIDNFYIEERSVMWVKRIWRQIEVKNNPMLFSKPVSDAIIKALTTLEDSISLYQEDEFWKVSKTIFDSSNYEIITYKIKEDCFFDNDRMVSESRIIGICPVIQEKKKAEIRETKELGWIYFPQLRKVFAKELLNNSNLPSHIKSLDDLFFFRYFYGQIYMESNVYARTISTYAKGKELETEAERIELSLIESEHDIWMGFTE
jgi:hypothetical protein